MPQAARLDGGEDLYEQYVNPQWVKLLGILDMNVTYDRCEGAELFTSDGRTILDFNSGYCVHNAGHNHPRIIAALKDELDRRGPAMLQAHVPGLAGRLAARLCGLAGGRASKAFFCSSGSEGVEAAIKFARAHTKRPGILGASGGFHGLTCGALSLMSNDFWKAGFGAMLPATEFVPYGDIGELEKKLRTKSFAAFIVEPVQAEGGVLIPPPDYLLEAQALCRRYGTVFVLDEVQTGFFRTGLFLAGHHFGVDPDIVILAKAISGGLIPCGAVLMTDAIYKSVYSSFKRALVHTSTFSENALAMRAGLATLDVLEDEGLGQRAALLGERLRGMLERAAFRLRNVRRGSRARIAERHRIQGPALAKAAGGLRDASRDPSRGFRPDAGHALVPRPWHAEPDLRKQLHGAESFSTSHDGGKPPRCLRPGNRANNQNSCTPSAVFGPKRLASRSAR